MDGKGKAGQTNPAAGIIGQVCSKLRISQHTLAKRLEISESHLAMISLGRRKVSLSMARKLEKLAGRPWHAFMDAAGNDNGAQCPADDPMARTSAVSKLQRTAPSERLCEPSAWPTSAAPLSERIRKLYGCGDLGCNTCPPCRIAHDLADPISELRRSLSTRG